MTRKPANISNAAVRHNRNLGIIKLATRNRGGRISTVGLTKQQQPQYAPKQQSDAKSLKPNGLASVPTSEQPDPYWSEDVVAGVIASVRAVLGVDDLHARTESQYPGGRRASGEFQVEE